MIDKHAFGRTLEEINRSIRGLATSGLRGFDCTPQSLEKLQLWGQSPRYFPNALEDVRAELGGSV